MNFFFFLSVRDARLLHFAHTHMNVVFFFIWCVYTWMRYMDMWKERSLENEVKISAGRPIHNDYAAYLLYRSLKWTTKLPILLWVANTIREPVIYSKRAPIAGHIPIIFRAFCFARTFRAICIELTLFFNRFMTLHISFIFLPLISVINASRFTRGHQFISRSFN